ncbi:MAG: hypothetical protein ABSB32_07625 [Thermodesulfobacteriota bacterium]
MLPPGAGGRTTASFCYGRRAEKEETRPAEPTQRYAAWRGSKRPITGARKAPIDFMLTLIFCLEIIVSLTQQGCPSLAKKGLEAASITELWLILDEIEKRSVIRKFSS